MQTSVVAMPVSRAAASPTALDLFIAAIDTLETTAAPLEEPARRALAAMIDTVDVAFQTARAIASGASPRSNEVRQPFLFTTMKMVEVSGHLEQTDDSKAVKTLQAIGKR
ncbi:hypothetical protein [Agrobacterium tumefaciens]|uniref:hypothetical protein n=1 Tax=Agrobacterium tumefaciens TaxID=358 RepID=UPI00104ED231|nr:hypothetical protein [Agrobacterium tumefaciens]TCV55153.1 hypothetical protein EDB97_101245 [Agrobacterium tumefaciens]